MSKAGLAHEKKRAAKPKLTPAEKLDARKGARRESITVMLSSHRKPFYEGDAKCFVDALEKLCIQYGAAYAIDAWAETKEPKTMADNIAHREREHPNYDTTGHDKGDTKKARQSSGPRSDSSRPNPDKGRERAGARSSPRPDDTGRAVRSPGGRAPRTA